MSGTTDSPVTLVALTGSLGSGKSTALAAFKGLGAAVLDCDSVVHDLLDREGVRLLVAEELGLGPLPSGRAGRERLADLVFTDPEMLGRLEAVLHPLVRDEIVEWRRSEAVAASPLAVVEIQMLFEAAMEDLFDAVVLVAASPDARRGRVADRLAGPDFDRRAARQLPDTEKAARCGYTYDNSGERNGLEAFVRGVFDDLSGDQGA